MMRAGLILPDLPGRFATREVERQFVEIVPMPQELKLWRPEWEMEAWAIRYVDDGRLVQAHYPTSMRCVATKVKPHHEGKKPRSEKPSSWSCGLLSGHEGTVHYPTPWARQSPWDERGDGYRLNRRYFVVRTWTRGHNGKAELF